MHSNSTFLPQTKTGTDLLIMLNKATQEGKAAAADLCSSRLEKLAAHAARDGLSATEIIELIREEAEVITSQGGAAWQ